MFGLGIGEIAVILFIALIFIGPKKLPGLAKGLGKGIREFQNAAKGIGDSINEPVQGVKDQINETKEQITGMNANEIKKDIKVEPVTQAQTTTDDEFGDVSPDHQDEEKK